MIQQACFCHVAHSSLYVAHSPLWLAVGCSEHCWEKQNWELGKAMWRLAAGADSRLSKGPTVGLWTSHG